MSLHPSARTTTSRGLWLCSAVVNVPGHCSCIPLRTPQLRSGHPSARFVRSDLLQSLSRAGLDFVDSAVLPVDSASGYRKGVFHHFLDQTPRCSRSPKHRIVFGLSRLAMGAAFRKEVGLLSVVSSAVIMSMGKVCHRTTPQWVSPRDAALHLASVEPVPERIHCSSVIQAFHQQSGNARGPGRGVANMEPFPFGSTLQCSLKPRELKLILETSRCACNSSLFCGS